MKFGLNLRIQDHVQNRESHAGIERLIASSEDVHANNNEVFFCNETKNMRDQKFHDLPIERGLQ